MICPVCKSPNIDAAKFCGGCGAPMAKSAEPASPAASLVTCAQGHVYSAVYQACPYCPQADRAATGDFATRIEPADFATRIEPMAETRVEPLPTVIQPPASTYSPATVIEPPAAQPRTGKMRSDYATVVDSGFSDNSPPTGRLNDAPTTQVTPVAPPPRPPQSSASATIIEPVARPQPPPVAPPPVAPPPVPPPPVTPPPVPQAVPVDRANVVKPQRRTVVVPNEGTVPQGRLIGWLVSFSRNQDGVDHRLTAGRTVIGANPACNIVIDEEAVSGTHASIVYRNGNCFIKDELSSNGTFVNGGEVVEPLQLRDHDEIRIGNTVLHFIALSLNV